MADFSGEHFRVQPGQRLHLHKVDTADTGPFKKKEDVAELIAKNQERLRELQGIMYAENKKSLLVVFQAMDCGGKDGAIAAIFTGVNPQGCRVYSFKIPGPIEASHDYLWRIHQCTPAKGQIAVFNRSHYESVLVERVKGIVPKEIWKKRYGHINSFEDLLADEGTLVVKFFLHISRAEQKRRLESRLDDPTKLWKFSGNDVKERAFWDQYQEAYGELLEKCSTKYAPWYVVPADKKWFRNWLILDVLVNTLENLKMKFPPAEPGIEKTKIPK